MALYKSVYYYYYYYCQQALVDIVQVLAKGAQVQVCQMPSVYAIYCYRWQVSQWLWTVRTTSDTRKYD